jgi:multicomponent Na+:H+ antiporter subunit A
MVAGSVHHATGLRDPGKLAGLWKRMPVTAFSSVAAGASLASLPLFLGFTAKEMALESVLSVPGSWVLASGISLVGMVFTAMFLWVALKPFMGRAKDSHAHESPLFMWSAGLVLALLGMVAAFVPYASFLEKAIFAISGVPVFLSNSAGHGSNHVLLWSIGSWTGGFFIYLKFQGFRAFLERNAKALRFGPEKLYQESLKGLAWLAKTQTHFLQSGSLRYYFRIVISTVIVLTGLAFLRAGWPEIRITPFYFFETFLAGLIVAGTLATLFTTEKLAAIAYLGVVGLSISLLFFLFGAPDLAMTQFAVEVLTLILLALVLYRLPHFKPMSSKRTIGVDAVLSILAGLTMFAFVFLAASQREGVLSAVARFYTENSWNLAHGRNIVNVILVDFRGLDTLGEITVIAIAGIGAYSLLKLIVGHKKEL